MRVCGGMIRCRVKAKLSLKMGRFFKAISKEIKLKAMEPSPLAMDLSIGVIGKETNSKAMGFMNGPAVNITQVTGSKEAKMDWES